MLARLLVTALTAAATLALAAGAASAKEVIGRDRLRSHRLRRGRRR